MGKTPEHDHDVDDEDEDRSAFPQELQDDDHDRDSDHVVDDAPAAAPAPAAPRVIHATRTTQWHDVVIVADDDVSRVEIGPVKIIPMHEDWKTRLGHQVRELEGRVSRMYLDHKGLVTVGIGHLLRIPKSAHHIPFQLKTGATATNEHKDAEWHLVHDQGAELRRLAKIEGGSKKAKVTLAQGTTLAMSEAAIDELFNRDLQKAIRAVEAGYERFANWQPAKPTVITHPRFDSLPDPAKIALCDMAFGLGTAGLFGSPHKSGFPKMLTAVKGGKFGTASEQCHIKNTRRETRNVRLRNLFVEADTEQKTAEQKTAAPSPAPARPAEPAPPKPRPAVVRATPRVTTVNTIGGRKRQPLVSPRVRLLAQWDVRWNRKPRKDPGILWKPPWPELGEKRERRHANWQNSGCCPAALAMVVRWWAEDNPTTQAKLKFPHGPAPLPDGSPAMNPVDVNHRLHGIIHVPGKWRAEKRIIAGKKVSEYGIDYMKTIHGPRGISLVGAPSTTMKTVWTPCHDAETAKELLRKGLAHGPMLANMTCPGHFVVVQGYRNGVIYICDPGNVLQEHWASVVQTGKEMPALDRLKVGEDHRNGPARSYVAIPDGARCTPTRGKPKGPLTWLESLIGLAHFYFDETDVHPEWG